MKLIDDHDIFTVIRYSLRQQRLPHTGQMNKADWTRVAQELNAQGIPLKPGRKYCTGRGVERFYHRYVQKHSLQEQDRTKTPIAERPVFDITITITNHSNGKHLEFSGCVRPEELNLVEMFAGYLGNM